MIYSAIVRAFSSDNLFLSFNLDSQNLVIKPSVAIAIFLNNTSLTTPFSLFEGKGTCLGLDTFLVHQYSFNNIYCRSILLHCNMKIETFECEDNYEAEKLAGLLTVQKDNSIFVSGIVAAMKNEIIILLKDRSSHSVTLKDENNASKLKSLIEDVITGKKIISESTYENYTARVIITD